MDELIIFLYVITAFVWTMIDIYQEDVRPSFANFVLVILRFIGFPVMVIWDKIDKDRGAPWVII